MLTRAVRRRQPLRNVQHAAEQIQLPWLCPALWSTHTTKARSSHRPITSPAKAKIVPRSSAPLSTNARNLAAAATAPQFGFLDSHRAYDSLTSNSNNVSSQKLPNLSPHVDLSQILMIDTTDKSPPELVNSGSGKRNWLTGTASDIEATLDACLQTRQWDRALETLSQLRQIYAADAPKTTELYNKTLSSMVFDYIWTGSRQNVVRINSWVEKTLKNARVIPNAETFALKIKAAMSSLSGRRRDRTVRRYWDLARDYNVNWEVASLRNILSDADLGKLSEIALADLETGQDADQDLIEPDEEIAVTSNLISERPLPTVLETDQKGLGLVSLRESMKSFTLKLPREEADKLKAADPEAYEEHLRQRQLQLEQDFLETALERWRKENERMLQMGISSNLEGSKITQLMWAWHEKLQKAIENELEKVSQVETAQFKTNKEKPRWEYGPFLRLVEPKMLAALLPVTIMQYATRVGFQDDLRIANIVLVVGRAVEAEAVAVDKKRRQALAKLTKQAQMHTHDGQATTQNAGSHDVQLTQRVANEPKLAWTSAIHAKLGSILCELFFDVATLDPIKRDGLEVTHDRAKHAFRRQQVMIQGRQTAVVAIHPDLVALLAREPAADIIAKQLPMVAKPAPWTGFDTGGYFETKNEFLRIKLNDPNQREYAEAAAERGDLAQVFKGLDVLGQTGWRINKDVFEVMLQAWNSGEQVANLAPLHMSKIEPAKPPATATMREKYQYLEAMQTFNNEKSGLHSERCFQNFQMEIARTYLDETFYLPHNVDFRGRAYPIPPYLNQMGADNARGLLLFDKGRKLGERGLIWLQVQLANVYGYDKASLVDRARFAMDHMDDARDAVNNPLNGRRWWLQAEDPWQCLAVCHELVKAVDSGDPANFVSHLPVHQDGTCNGLQHYAALGGDVAGARQVNLEPGDRPADVYTGVCELVKAAVAEDADRGFELAKALQGKIARKIVKQTVMTNVYGVTFIGAVRQVRKQLADYMPELSATTQQQAATYIARNIFQGLGTLFQGAHNIQYWFGDCASRITNSISPAQLNKFALARAAGPQVKVSKNKPEHRGLFDSSHFRSSVVWTTPLKLPVIQPYYENKSQTIETHLLNIKLREPRVDDPVDKRKQLQGFPPNFVHSLDASHMMLSAIAAHERGLSFSAVHDSFWTHAADVDVMNSVLRDAFIDMHSEDIIGRLAEEFKIRYEGHLYLAKVTGNSALGGAIRKHRKSLTDKIKLEAKQMSQRVLTKGTQSADLRRRLQFEELMLEKKRQELLKSDQPEQQQEGRSMVTAASIFDKYGGEQYLSSTVSLGETASHSQSTPDRAPDLEVLAEALDHGEQQEAQDVDMAATLQPLLEQQQQQQQQQQQEEQQETNKKAPRRGKKSAADGTSSTTVQKPAAVWLWLPLTFKDVPQKGDWDVRRLKESTYFFS